MSLSLLGVFRLKMVQDAFLTRRRPVNCSLRPRNISYWNMHKHWSLKNIQFGDITFMIFIDLQISEPSFRKWSSWTDELLSGYPNFLLKCQRYYSSMDFMCIMWCIFATLACQELSFQYRIFPFSFSAFPAGTWKTWISHKPFLNDWKQGAQIVLAFVPLLRLHFLSPFTLRCLSMMLHLLKSVW